MTFQEIASMIESIGLPFSYYMFKGSKNDPVPPLPYVIFYYPQSDNFGADNNVYQNITRLNVELYSENKDFDSEKLVEDVLIENDIFFEKYESYIESENMYEVLYESEVIINGE